MPSTQERRVATVHVDTVLQFISCLKGKMRKEKHCFSHLDSNGTCTSYLQEVVGIDTMIAVTQPIRGQCQCGPS